MGSSDNEGIIKIARNAIKLVIVLVLLGYLMIWIMAPTNTYTQVWQAKIYAKSTLYGPRTGGSMLIFSFPILFVAVLGCIYLHLGTKLNNNIVQRDETNRLAILKRPILVRGPLGILSGVEFAFFIMFIALLVWSISVYLHYNFPYITAAYLAQSGDKMWETKLEYASYFLGIVGNIVLAFIFFPVARASPILPVFGLTSEGSIKYHIWLGHIAMLLFSAHGFGFILYWVLVHKAKEEMSKWAKTGVSNVAGELALLAGLVMWATTIPKIRRKFFELFFYTHYLYILFMIFFFLHVEMPFVYIMLPGFYLFVIDRYLRFLQSRQNVRLVSARVLPCETVELNFAKSAGLSYTATSTIFVNVPSISKMQWHPFTITSSSNLEQDKLSVIIKSEGSWSRKLHQILSSPTAIERLSVSIEGPYGPASTNFLKHDELVMVSGGSGITPFISIIRDLISASTTLKSETPKITLICAFKKSSDLTMLDLLIPLSGTFTGFSNLDIQIHAFVTKEKTTTNSNNILQTIWFKPNASDVPIPSTLGKNAWLWMAAIASCSFVMFLLLLGIITRFYINPIDHNTDKIYSTTHRALLFMLLMCACIAVTASVAVVWNKKDNAKEAKQVQNSENSTPMTSPSSWIYNSNRDLESSPQQSIALATKVVFGERPDLKKMLTGCKGSSVGVLTCGPKKLRHNVADICSSGSAQNLHFESISFSW